MPFRLNVSLSSMGILQVLIPIFIIMMFFTMLREYAGRFMNATSSPDIKVFQQTQVTPPRTSHAFQRPACTHVFVTTIKIASQALQRAALLRSSGNWLPEASWTRRRAFYTDKVSLPAKQTFFSAYRLVVHTYMVLTKPCL
jgi:hypothetical protein